MKDIILLILIIIFLLICSFHPSSLENWVPYKQKPLNYIKTGRNPLKFYKEKRYRLPYRFPFKFIKSYPVDHLSYLN